MLKQCHHTFSQEAQFVSCTLFNKRCTLEKTVNLRRKYQMVLTLGVLFKDTPENMEKKLQNAFGEKLVFEKSSIEKLEYRTWFWVNVSFSGTVKL